MKIPKRLSNKDKDPADKDLYKCTRDLQGGSFAVDISQTIEEWRETAISWADSDESFGVVKELKKLPANKIIDYISEFWTLEIIKIYKNQVRVIPGNEDYPDELIDISMVIDEKAKEFHIHQASEKMAFYMMMYLKYNRIISNDSYYGTAKDSLSNDINSDDIDIAIEKSKIILKEKYSIDVEQEKPLILSSSVPFNEIKEDFD